MMTDAAVLAALGQGTVLPAHPLALDANRRLDERRQRALSRYYLAAGAGGLAVGVHTTQFAIRDVGLYEPVLALAAEEMDRADAARTAPLIRVAGLCGDTRQAVSEAETAAGLGFHAGLLNLAALGRAGADRLLAHCQAVADVIDLFGFYLQPAIGGCSLPFSFWRRFAEIENVVAIKVAAFDRYHTIDVVRALAEAGRDDIALYTGNDDTIVLDLVTPYQFRVGGRRVQRRFVGGLLGHWAVWTRAAVELHDQCREVVRSGSGPDPELLARAVEVTDANAAFFDAANQFAGCVPGIHEVLRRQGLLEGIWCLNPKETLGPGQAEQIDRVSAAYPHLSDDAFVAEHRDRWLAG